MYRAWELPVLSTDHIWLLRATFLILALLSAAAGTLYYYYHRNEKVKAKVDATPLQDQPKQELLSWQTFLWNKLVYFARCILPVLRIWLFVRGFPKPGAGRKPPALDVGKVSDKMWLCTEYTPWYWKILFCKYLTLGSIDNFILSAQLWSVQLTDDTLLCQPYKKRDNCRSA